MKRLILLCAILVYGWRSFPVTRPHTVSFGKQSTITIGVGDDATKTMDVKIRTLLVDGQIKEYVIGAIHEVTTRTFVVQRVYRLNDSLPQEASVRWKWERGGWIQVDRISGKVHSLNLQSFEPALSSVSWFRDYAAYCGLSEDGQKSFVIVAQLGRRKPLLKSPIGSAGDNQSYSLCQTPEWQRSPPRVTFLDSSKQRVTFSITSRTIDLSSSADSGDEN